MRLSCLLAMATVATVVTTAIASPFQNLDFKAAIVAPAPANYTPNDAFNPISATAALPGWTTHEDTTATNAIWGIPAALDETSIALISTGAIQGQYSVELTSYADAPPNLYRAASISQTGDIPAGTRSIHFSIQSTLGVASGTGPIVTLNGTPIPVFQTSLVGTTSQWTGDVSAFAGTTPQLTFTAAGVPGKFPTDEDGYILDSISFSAQPAPEPATLGIFAGALAPLILRRTPCGRKGVEGKKPGRS